MTFLKRDMFGTIRRISSRDANQSSQVERDTCEARWGCRWVARRLAGREARALSILARVDGVPRLIAWDGRRLVRTWVDGRPMHIAKPVDRAYFREALRLLRRLHAAGIVHNDLAKEPNWLVTPHGAPGLLDFQLSMRPIRRGWRFRALAYDDLRHLLKHKRTYCPQALTSRERAILERRSVVGETWHRTGKPLYRFVTRGLLRWSDREGAGDRQR